MKLAKSILPLKLFCSVIICFLSLSLFAQKQKSINVPDANFREVLSSEYGITFDANNNISNLDHATYFSEMNVSSKAIKSLSGIEAFTSLIRLDCRINEITHLDISQNTALEYLECRINKLTELDVSRNEAMKSLTCRDNQLTELDFSNNPKLTHLESYGNLLTHLDLSSNTLLTHLDCAYNQLNILDVHKSPSLQFLNCSENNLAQLDVSNNVRLAELRCNKNQLDMLDVSKNDSLSILDCSENRLSSLNVSNNSALFALLCENNQLTSLDVSKNPVLFEFYCADNQLTSLDVSKNPKLRDLHCENNLLTNLDLSQNHRLENLDYGTINPQQVIRSKNIKRRELQDAIGSFYANNYDTIIIIKTILDVLIILVIFYLIIKSPNIKKISKKLLVLMSVFWIINIQLELRNTHGFLKFEEVLQYGFWAVSLIVLLVFLILTRKTKKAKWDWLLIFLITPVLPILLTILIGILSNAHGLSYYLENNAALPFLSVELIGVFIIIYLMKHNQNAHPDHNVPE